MKRETKRYIRSEQFHVFPGTGITVCCLTMINGFSVTGLHVGTLENFDAELGKTVSSYAAARYADEFLLFRQCEMSLSLNAYSVVKKVADDLHAMKAEPAQLSTQSESRFYRVTDIIGDRKRGIPAIFPVSKSYWLKGVRAGKFPKPIRLSPGAVVWKGSDIDALIQQFGAGEKS